MSDIKIVWDADNEVGDWEIQLGDLVTGDDLETAILVSLMTDRVARDDDDYGTKKRGWWGDTDADYAIGSRLWLLRRRRLTSATATDAETYANEALQWLIDDGIVSSFTVETQIVYPTRLYMSITYQKPDGAIGSLKYGWVWSQIK